MDGSAGHSGDGSIVPTRLVTELGARAGHARRFGPGAGVLGRLTAAGAAGRGPALRVVGAGGGVFAAAPPGGGGGGARGAGPGGGAPRGVAGGAGGAPLSRLGGGPRPARRLPAPPLLQHLLAGLLDPPP